MDMLINCTLPAKANNCKQGKCSKCGWDREVLAARRELMATQGLTDNVGIEYLALPGKEKPAADEKDL